MADDRTEAATPRRLQRARDAGDVPVSREVTLFAGFAAAVLALMLFGPALMRDVLHRLAGQLAAAPAAVPQQALSSAVLTLVAGAGPVAAVALVAVMAGSLLQTGLIFNPAALLPDFGRLDPRLGLRRVFGAENLITAGKAIAKVALLGFAAYHALAPARPRVELSLVLPPIRLLDTLSAILRPVVFSLLGGQCAIMAADLLLVRMRYASRLRMTREEVRQEAKETDGNPQIKQRLRQLRFARARRRMLAAVPKATVVVTNPTHYAIALSYDGVRKGAPIVVAKGVDEIAVRIREVARENRVPLVANPPLARALYQVDLDREVPVEHFKAVAEIIAYVWRLKARKPR